ncbi:streptophobe family protein [Streptomyces bambusae]|uniref:streptophobe family protein n=1 Tax=Streptomyces bambusae TaxID=1550616 RepID=UPI001CFD334C|nr:streptophobe family protein [Streptomyces bambusae]
MGTAGPGFGAVPVAGAGRRVRWGDVLASAVAAAGWALVAMAGVAALGLHLLEADGAGRLGPMTAAVVVLAVGGSVTPSGDVSVFGLDGAEAATVLSVRPLGVGLAGALVLSAVFLRSLRAAGVAVSRGELVVRAGAVAVVFTALCGGLAWAGRDVVTLDGEELGVGGWAPPSSGGGLEVPGLGDIGGLLPDRIGDLVEARAQVGYAVDTAATLRGAAVWVLGVLLVAVLASRRVALPGAWARLDRWVRPAVSAVVAVLLLAVAAGLAAAGWAMAGDARPDRIAGAALLGAPNGTWLAVPLGMFVPVEGRASGALAGVLPDPLDEVLSVSAREPVTVARLAELDGRVWLLVVAVAVLVLAAGVLTGVRARGHGGGPLGAALVLGLVLGGAVAGLVWLTGVSVDASLSVLGMDAVGAGLVVRGDVGWGAALGGVWGVGAGLVGWGVAAVRGAAVPGAAVPGSAGVGVVAAGPYRPSPVRGLLPGEVNPYRVGGGVGGAGAGGGGGPGAGGGGGPGATVAGGTGDPDATVAGGWAGLGARPREGAVGRRPPFTPPPPPPPPPAPRR